jgi:exopolyphosphatase / guanosine-5'-triphosphate,3'-diphosphate pyrophosphatase
VDLMHGDRVAAIDIGTNSVLLLIAEIGATGLFPVLERATITRLGEGVDRTRELAPAACERTLRCLVDYAEEIARYGVLRAAAVGTSALRDARGGPDFAREAERTLGIAPRVIDGRREAELTFRGALSGLAVTGPVTVFDVGGGSTELVHGYRDETLTRIDSAKSLDIGSVRLFERHAPSDPPGFDELTLISDEIDRALAHEPAHGESATLVGVAGTVTTLAALSLKLTRYEPAKVHGHQITREAVSDLFTELALMPLAERTALPGLDPRRADVIVVGSLIVERVMTHLRASDLVVSDRGVRWGLAEELAAEKD